MALVINDRVRETTTVTGTNDATLLGAVTGFQDFSVIGNGNTTYYTISDQAGGNWEVGIGTFSSVGPTLARTTVLSSSAGGAKVSFPAGTKDVFVTYPSEKAVTTDKTNTFTASQVIDVTDNSNAALRITQNGTGNALLVEDAANPDASPFAITADGSVLLGTTQADGKIHIVGEGVATTAIVGDYSNNDPAGMRLYSQKARGTSSAKAIVLDGDQIGGLYYTGYDGSVYRTAALIQVSVDGTPGTNDMPGRLTFSTTADGSSSPTERMRIASSGKIAIGGTFTGNSSFRIDSVLDGGTNAYALTLGGTIQPTVTSSAFGFFSSLLTAGNGGTPYTIGNIFNMYAEQGPFINADSTVTNQFGFFARNNLTGAVNNFGFSSNIPSGTGRWNFYAAGTADNYFAGEVLIGSPLVITSANSFITPLQVSTGNTNNSGVGINAFSSGSGTGYIHFNRSKSNTIGTNTLVVNDDVLGAVRFSGADGTNFINAAQIQAQVDGTPGTNDMPGRLVFSTTADGASSTTERMRIDNAGRIRFGGAPSVTNGFTNSIPLTGGTTSFSTVIDGIIQPDSTSGVAYARVSSSTAANGGTPYTITNLRMYQARQGTFNADSTVTNQYGFLADSDIIGATNDYGFFGNIPAATGRWNFYASGTADNYMAGQLQLGAGSAGTPALSAFGDTNTGIFFPAADTIAFTEGGVEGMRITSAGDVGIGVTAPTAKLHVTNTGTGNSFLVEDSTNPDSSPFVIDASGLVVVGHTANIAGAASRTPWLQVTGTSNSTSSESLNTFSTTPTTSPAFQFNKSANATIGSHTLVVNNETLGNIQFAGSDGTGFIQGASINAFVDGTPGTNDMPGRLVFSTTNDGASFPLERMRINSSGNVLIGTTANTNSSLLVSNGTISETVSGVQYLVASQFDVGTAPNEIPLNQYLGTLAYQTFVPYNGVGSAAPTIASATTIAPQTPIIFVSGTTAIVTITPPATLVGGGQLTIIPTGIFTTTTAGNIALASTAVVSRALIMTYDATTNKWYPSY